VSQLAVIFLPALLAAAATWLLTPLSISLALRVGAVDRPGPRRIQTHPVPRLGGVAVVTVTVSLLAAGALGVGGMAAWAPREVSTGVLLGLVPILAISIRDDVSHVGAFAKFLAHAAGAGVAIAYGVVLPPEIHLFGATITLGWAAVPLSFLWLTGITNAFNLVDGLDGLSAGLGLISAASLTAVLLLARDPELAAAVAVLAGSIIGFLPRNLYPAKVFLGDSGATAIGYLLACFSLNTTALLSAGLATLIPMLLVGVPVADTLVSMVRRTISRLEHGTGNRVYEADGNHIHHRLLALGLSHRRAVITLYAAGGLLAAVALSSLMLTRQQSGYLLAGILIAGFIGLRRLGYNEFALLRRGVVLRLYDLPVLRTSFFEVFADIAMVAVAAFVAVGLKYDQWDPAATGGQLFAMIAILTPTTVASFTLFGMYRGSWRLAGIDDFRRLFLGVITGAVSGAALFALVVPWHVPPSLFAIYAFVAVLLANAARVSYQLAEQITMRAGSLGEPALIYGAGVAGAGAVREMLSNPAVGLRPAGFIDDDAEKTGKLVNGYPILGTVDEIDEVLIRLGAAAIVVSSARIPGHKVTRAQQVCEAHGARLFRMRIDFEEVGQPDAGAGPVPAESVAAAAGPPDAPSGRPDQQRAKRLDTREFRSKP
jgi:UDP-GlcNAc:undecaprenyl-phosphate GlcNAc-1-phosphate transferase